MLSIGKMSQAAQVSINTLRYYDQIGLLKPTFIDEQNGYCYYNTEQLDVLIEISRLKRFNFSLEEIIALMRLPHQQKLTILKNQHSKLSYIPVTISTYNLEIDVFRNLNMVQINPNLNCPL